MNPGRYNLSLTENSTNTLSFTIAGITTASGYSAAVDIRATELPGSTLLLGLTSPSSGLTLASDGTNLTISMTITEAQVDTLAPLLVTNATASWSLKVTAPGGATTQYLKGRASIIRTPTA